MWALLHTTTHRVPPVVVVASQVLRTISFKRVLLLLGDYYVAGTKRHKRI
jgi:hypothetical protein